MSLRRADLKKYILSGCKNEKHRKIGIEWEKLGVYRATGRAIGYFGARGVEAIFKALIREHGWQNASSETPIVALKKGRSSITLEPGGQIELSGYAYAALKDNAWELDSHLIEIESVSQPLGIAWLGLGAQPFSRLDEIRWVPKARYRIMRRFLSARGSLSHAMMKQTACIQANLDFTSEEDAIQKLRLAFALAPVLSRVFANSPVYESRLVGRESQRAWIWRHTDPARTGILKDVFRADYTLEDYVDYALSVPMFFIVRGGRWIAAPRLDFRRFMENGFRGFEATLGDWKLHLTTIFTEARLKQYLEIRSLDCQNREMGLAAIAFLKGIFYRALSSERALKILLGVKRPNLAWELLELAQSGLNAEESGYLEPLQVLLERKKTPARILIGCLKKARLREEKVQTLIACAAV